MIIFYVDESGTGLGKNQTPFFVLSALSFPASEWRTIDQQVVSLKRRLVSWAKPEDFEIKGRVLRRGEMFFKGHDWKARAQAFNDIAQLIADLPCQIFAVQVDKRDLPSSIGSQEDLYRLAFWRLLEEIELALAQVNQSGMLLMDGRSDLHSSVQDRRLVDAYREWQALRQEPSHLIELPWFGFSEFYVGLQLADFAAYLIDFVAEENLNQRRSEELQNAFAKMEPKIRLVCIP